MPQQLNFLDRPAPESPVWEHLDDEQRTAVIETMARVIGKAAVPTTNTTTEDQEKIHD